MTHLGEVPIYLRTGGGSSQTQWWTGRAGSLVSAAVEGGRKWVRRRTLRVLGVLGVLSVLR